MFEILMAAIFSSINMCVFQAIYSRALPWLPTWRLPHSQAYELRSITANLMSKLCSDVCIEPHLQPLSGEQMHYKSANQDEGTHLDVCATNFWSNWEQWAFFDIRHRKHEQEKRREYDQRVREVEYGCFSPLVFNTLRGMEPTTHAVFKRIASLMAINPTNPIIVLFASFDAS